MSERQAKLKRKNEVVNTPAKKKKGALDIISNIIIVVLILAVLGIGSWAVYSKFSQMAANNNVVAPTISEYANSEGLSVEEFMAKYGLGAETGLTGESLISDAMEYMTLANYAALVGTDVAQIKESMGLGDEYTDDTPMSVIYDNVAAQTTDDETQSVEVEEVVEGQVEEEVQE